MEATIDDILKPIDGFLISITRDTTKGWYELQIGIQSSWVFNENKQVACEVLNETEAGKLVKISPKNSKIKIDDLVKFVNLIIETNKRIAEKEMEFTKNMEKMKLELEESARKYYEELDKLREDSFKKVGDDFVEGIDNKKTTTKRKPRTTTKKTVSEEKPASETDKE